MSRFVCRVIALVGFFFYVLFRYSVTITVMKIVATILFLMLILLQLQLWFGSHGVFQLWSLNKTIEQSQAENAGLAERNDQLHAEVIELKKGQEALEERARSQLGFIKDGEVFYRVIPDSSSLSNEKSE